jgi:hypothetical protein
MHLDLAALDPRIQAARPHPLCDDLVDPERLLQRFAFAEWKDGKR